MKPLYSSKLALLIAILLGFNWSINAQTTVYSYTGSYQTFTAPAGVTVISVDMSGAAGGADYFGTSYGSPGGGGRVQCLLNVTPGTTYYIYVGQQGTNSACNCTYSGGYNGGGSGTEYGGSGGGGTDIRTAASGTAYTGRLVVAGGGGGAGCYYGTDNGGAGGGLVGGNGGSGGGACYYGSGGTQTAGGASGTCGGSAGTLGVGGNYGCCYAGGGGGGYYGGGGSYAEGGGGGGSSYTSSSVIPASVIHTQGFVASGNGSVTITIPPPGGGITPSSLAFGPVVVSSVSPSQCVALNFYNLSPSSGSLTVTSPPGFLASVDGGMTWGSSPMLSYTGGGSTANVCFEFAPTTYATYSATATITGGSIPTAIPITLTGTGVFPCSGTPAGGTASASPVYSNPTTPFVVSATGEAAGGGVTYSWASSSYPTFGFAPISGMTTPTLTVSGISANTYYELVTTCPGSGISSPSSIVEVMDTSTSGTTHCVGTPPSGTVSPDVASACSAYTANLSYTAPATTSIGFQYQWQSSPNGSTFTAIPGATNNYYSVPVTGLEYYNLQVTCFWSGGVNYSNTTSVSLLQTPTAITGNLPVCNPIPSILSSSPSGGVFTITNPSIATVGGTSGIVNGVSSGADTVIYTLSDGCKTSIPIAVSNAPVPVSGFSSVCAGSSTTAFTDATPGGTWVSSNTTVATVGTLGTLNGVVNGITAGSAIIDYVLPSGCMSTDPVTVNPLPAAVTGTANVCVGSTTTLTDASAGGTWVSSSFNATVGASTGIVSGVSPGSTNIIYTLPTGCQKSLAVTINSLPSAIVPLTAASACVGLGFTLTDSTAGGSFTSSNTSIATVAPATGAVSGISAGNANVTYTVGSTGCRVIQGVVINALPTIHMMTATNMGQYCAGGTGVYVGLNGSTTGINYELYSGTTDLGTFAGTSSALDFGPFTNTTGSPVTYTSVATNTGTGCMSNMSGVATVYPANPLPVVDSVTGGGNNCSGGTGVDVSLGGSDAGVQYQLYDGITLERTITGTGGLSTDFGLQTANGTYTVVGKTAAGCMANMTGSATVNTYAAINSYPVTGGGNYCIGGVSTDTVGLGNSDAGINYTLYQGTDSITMIAGVGGNINFGAQSMIGVYTVVASNPGTACKLTMTGSATIGTVPLPTVYTVTGGGNYCIGSTGSHIGLSNSVTGVSYQLLLGGSVVATVAGSYSGLDFGPQTTPGTYTVVAIDNASTCSDNMAGSATIDTNSLPVTYMLSSGAAYCAGGTGVDVNLPASDIGVLYQLYNGSVAVGAPMSSTGGGPIDFGYKTIPGTYTVEATNPSTTCTSGMTGSSVITVNPLPVAYNVMGGGNYCTGGTGAPVVLNSSQAGVTYQVYLAGVMIPGASVTGTGSSLSLGLFTGVGNYTVQAATGAGCTNNMNGSVNIATSPLPAVYAVTGGGNYCSGGAGEHVRLSTTNASINYQLLLSGVPTGLPVAGTGFTYDFGARMAAGTYQVVGTNPLTGCTDTMSGSAAIAVNSLPVVYSVINGGAYCSGGTGVNVSLSNSTPAVKYQLYRGTALAGTTYGNGSILNFLETTPGVYTAVATDTATGCSANQSSSAMVSVNPLPAVFALGGGGNYCAGSVTGVSLTLASSTTGINYVLYYGGTGVDSIVSAGGTLTFPAQTGVGAYTVVAENTATGCNSSMTGSAMIGVTPNVIPAVMISTGMGDSVCSGAAVTFTAIPVNGGTAPTYHWMVGGMPISGVTGSTYTYVPVSGDVVMVTVTSNAPCPLPATASNTLPVTVLNTVTPSVSISSSAGNNVCAGTSTTLTAAPSYGGTTPTYSWLVNGFSASSSSSYTYSPVNSDDVLLVMTSNYPCRTATSVNSNNVVFDVTTPITPVFTIAADPGTIIGKYNSVTFTSNVAIANNGSTIQWSVNGVPVTGATEATFVDDTLQHTGDIVSCTITSPSTCGPASATQSLVMTVNDLSAATVKGGANDVAVVPNPNNGAFTVKGSLLVTTDQQVTLEVTDMLGQVVYAGQVLVKNGVINEQIKLTNNIANGMYILNVRTDSGNSIFHFVIAQ